MITVVAIDALEYDLVEEFDMVGLKQSHYGKTDISEFSEPRTIVLWSSFMTGRDQEKHILGRGTEKMWSTRMDHKDTFFSEFRNPYIIDLPGYNYNLGQHERERALLKEFFSAGEDEKNAIRNDLNDLAFKHYRKTREEFSKALCREHDFILGYFSIADVVGHLSFGNSTIMRIIYKDLNEIVSNIEGRSIVLSDHGMKAVGDFGDHSDYGFWSTNYRDLGNPKITDFVKIITAK